MKKPKQLKRAVTACSMCGKRRRKPADDSESGQIKFPEKVLDNLELVP